MYQILNTVIRTQLCLFLIIFSSCDSDDNITLCTEGLVSLDESQLCYNETDALVLEKIKEANQSLS